MAISTYDDLRNAISDYADRSYGASTVAIFVGNAEAKFNRSLASSFRRMDTTTLTTDASGEATLPSGFIGLKSIVRDVSGSKPLTQVSWDALVDVNPYATEGDPVYYAIRGTTLKVAEIVEDNFTAIFDSKLTALSDSNTTNWLLSLAPDCYLTMCLAEEKLYTKDYAAASALEQAAYGMLGDIVAMDQVASLSNATMILESAP